MVIVFYCVYLVLGRLIHKTKTRLTRCVPENTKASAQISNIIQSVTNHFQLNFEFGAITTLLISETVPLSKLNDYLKHIATSKGS